jgi:hypothetical protein
MNPPDDVTPAEELQGLNIPEFNKAIVAAAGYAHGYYWKPMQVWCSKANKRKFQIVRKSEVTPKLKEEWELITTITPHGGFSK